MAKVTPTQRRVLTIAANTCGQVYASRSTVRALVARRWAQYQTGRPWGLHITAAGRAALNEEEN